MGVWRPCLAQHETLIFLISNSIAGLGQNPKLGYSESRKIPKHSTYAICWFGISKSSFKLLLDKKRKPVFILR